MIARLKGTLTGKFEDHVIVDIGGVGYQAFVSSICLRELPATGVEVLLHIYTHVREDQLTLFGFASHEEKSIFLRLLNVSGIGPKMALTILSGLAPHAVVDAVIKEDLACLNSIQGVGKKTAERIIVDLKDKFIKEFGGAGAMHTTNKPLYHDTLSALINLGYPKIIAEKTLAKVRIGNHTTVQTAVKEALKELQWKKNAEN